MTAPATGDRADAGGKTGPMRIQRKRTAGWRMPENTVYVGRGSKWGNPFRVGSRDRRTGGIIGQTTAVERYLDALVLGGLAFLEATVSAELRGKNLACWCPIGQACHADVLLELANTSLPLSPSSGGEEL